MKGKKLFLILLIAMLSVSGFSKVKDNILNKAKINGKIGVRKSVPKDTTTGIPSSIPSGISSGIPSGISSGIPSGISTGVIPGIPSGIPSGAPSNDCVNVATAVATNVSFAQSDLGEATAVANTMAQAGDVTAISNVIATIDTVQDSLKRVYAVAVSAAIAVHINICPELKEMLVTIGIQLETAIASTMGVALATNNPEDLQLLNASLTSAAENMRNSIKLFK